MALSTRRMSGMVAQAGPGGQALLDTLDAFKRKHVIQNKEIIHRNSDLMRNNADLTKQLREAHDELVATRAENAALKAHNAQLQSQVRKLERQKQRLEGHQAPGAEQQKLQHLCAQLDSVVLQLQHVKSVCLDGAYTTGAEELVDSPPAGYYADLPNIRPDGTSSLSRRVRAGSEGPQRIVSTNPDLSLVDEASQEPSLTASQRLGGIGYDEDEELEDDLVDVYDVYKGTTDDHTVHAQDQAQTGQILLSSLVSRQSSVEPEDVANQIQDALVASPLRAGGLWQKSQSLSPSPSPPPAISQASLATTIPAPEPESLEAVLEVAQDTKRQSRRRNSGVLLQPPPDVRQQDRISASRPSLLQELSINPGQFDLSISNMDTSSRQKSRKRSMSSASVSIAGAQEDMGGLSRTIRPSSSASSLRSSSASPEATKSVPAALVATSRVKRRKSVPSINADTASSSTNILDQVFNSSRTNGTTKPKAARTSSVQTSSVRTDGGNTSRASSSFSAEARKPLVSSMQGRPTGGPVSLTVSSKPAALGSKSAVQGKVTPAATVVTSVRRVSTSSYMKAAVTEGKAAGSNVTRGARSRSTTPDAPPPTAEMDFTPILQELQTETVELTPSDAPSRVARVAAPLTPIVLAGAGQASNTVKADKGKGKPRESIVETVKKPVAANRVAVEETSLASSATDSQTTSYRSSQSSSSAASPTVSSQTSISTLAESQERKQDSEQSTAVGGREGRRARSAVNYQEPSLTKKMRQPAGYVSSIKTVVSTRGVSGHQTSSAMGVRRKSSLEAIGQRRSNLSGLTDSSAPHRLESVSDSEEENEAL